jgi:hypothetical protein
MTLSDEVKRLIEENISKLKEYSSWNPASKKPPSGYSDCLTFRLSIIPHLNIEPIIDELLIDGKDGLVQRLKDIRDKSLNEVKSWNKKYKPEHFMHLPDNVLQDDVLALAVALEMILSEGQQIEKKSKEPTNGVFDHPALKLLSEESRKRIIFGDIEWPKEFDEYISENPKIDEYEISQMAWLAKASAYILMHLKRWVEESITKESKIYHWYADVINPFTYRMVPIKQPCEDMLDVLSARLPNLEKRFSEQHGRLLSVAEKADSERISNPVVSINSFKTAAKDFHGTVFMIHSEAIVGLEKLTKPVYSEAGDETKTTPETERDIDKIFGDKFSLWGLEIYWRNALAKLKKLISHIKTILHKEK